MAPRSIWMVLLSVLPLVAAGCAAGASTEGAQATGTSVTIDSGRVEGRAAAVAGDAEPWVPTAGTGTTAATTGGDQPASDGTGTAGDAIAGAATDDPDVAPAADGGGPVELVPLWPRDSGDEVVALQERLSDLGFAPGPADGDYGGRTVRAVKAFQDLVGLSQTGWADSPTIEALAGYRYDGLVLHAGEEGDEVEALQERLAGGPLDPGPADGRYGGKTIEAVWALEKLAGIPVDGDWGPLDEKAWEDLLAGKIGHPEKEHDQRWVEVDLSQQLVKVYDPGQDVPTLVSHASSGSGIPWSNEEHSGSSVTPLGDFHISRRIDGWRESSLDIGRLYNPLYFNGGIALHGALSVPLYPASHGCVRLPMHIADYLPDELPDGTPVHVVA